MDIITLLPVGFLVGMGHALEADHVAAVATMMDRPGGRRAVIARGAFWGLGHAVALFAICGVVVLFGLTFSGRLEKVLEIAVGAMILGLGVQVLWRLRRDRMHVHVHDHGDHRHVHVHSHLTDPAPHAESAHAHAHRRTNAKAVAIGVMHGSAGSAGLLVLIMATTLSARQALAYFAVFGIGTILGMASLTAVASLPLVALHRGAAWTRNLTTLAIGSVAIWVGTEHAVTQAMALWSGSP